MKNILTEKNKIEQKKLTSTEPKKLSQILPLDQSTDVLNNNINKICEVIINIEESRKKRQILKNFEKYIGWAIMLIVPLISAFYGLHIYSKDSALKNELFSKESALKREFQKEQELQMQIRQKIQILEKQINDKIAKRDTINSAITNIRSIFEIGNLYCKKGIAPTSNFSFVQKQINVIFQLVTATYSIDQIFDDEIEDISNHFLKLADIHRDAFCKNSIEIIHQLRFLQGDINKKMKESISKDKEIKKNLM